MRAAAIPRADPQLEFHWLPDPGFLIQGFLIQCLHRGFTSAAEARSRGRLARASKAGDPRPEVGQREE